MRPMRWPVIPKSQSLQHSVRTRPFFTSWLRRIAPDTHQDQARGDEAAVALAAWRPRRTLSAARPRVHHRPVAAESSAPIPGWLTLRAIRVCCKRGDGDTTSIQTDGVAPVPNAGLPARRTHAKQRVTSNGFFSFRMWSTPRQLVRQRLDPTRCCPRFLPFVEAFRFGAVAQRKVGRLDERPSQYLFAFLVFPSPFFLPLLVRSYRRSARRGKVAAAAKRSIGPVSSRIVVAST